ncbi:MAG: NADH-quinone oxidoreductase subunit L [Candidatus Desulforudis sp.]|nr:NADH-quinone oxidoreductase subunit L [Desulforudis sp.]
MAGETLIAILILLPLATAAVGLAVKDDKLRRPFIILPSMALIAASVLLLFRVLDHGTITFTPSGTWDPIILILELALLAYFLYLGVIRKHVLVLGLAGFQLALFCLLKFAWLPSGFKAQPALHVDLLAVVMCLVISVVGSLIVMYGLNYMQNHERHLGLTATRQHIFFFFLVGFLGAMNGLVFANSLLWLFFFWEITTLCCYHLIRHDLTDEAEQNAMRALWMNLVGGVAVVGGMALTYQASGTLSMMELTGFGTVGPVLLLPLALFCLAGFTKAAQVPFQSWLLGAMVAPTPVSALLHSSTMVKAGVYLVLRLAPAYQDTYLSAVLAIFGAFVFMVTSLLAISQPVSKRVLAYSTISSLGLIICLAGINSGLAVAAAVALIIFHAVTKGVLFLVVGIVEQDIHSRNIEDMEGLTARLPVISGLAIAGMIVMLFVPFGVLFAKWAGIQAAATPFSEFYPLVVVFLAVGSAAGMVFWVRWIGRLISNVTTADGPPAEVRREPRASVPYLVVFSLVGGAVVLSVLAAPLVSWLINPAIAAMGYSPALDTAGWYLTTPFGSFSPWALFIVVALALLLPALLVKARPEEVMPVYLCGVNQPAEGPTFRSIADTPAAVETGGMYWTQAFGERSLNTWVNGAGIVLLAALFLGVIM